MCDCAAVGPLAVALDVCAVHNGATTASLVSSCDIALSEPGGSPLCVILDWWLAQWLLAASNCLVAGVDRSLSCLVQSRAYNVSLALMNWSP
jgi:hypothetical protein